MMRQDQRDEEHFSSAERRKRTLWIVFAHVLVVAAFFVATFFWGKFD